MGGDASVQQDDQTLPFLTCLCNRFWGKSDDGRDGIYKRYTIEIPHLNDLAQSSLTTYTVIDLGPEFQDLFRPNPHCIMLRQDYVDLVSHIKTKEPLGARGVLVTGQPGIGKSYFLYYLLIERVLEGKVTAWHNSTTGVYLLLGPNNVVFYPGHAVYLEAGDYPGAWALSDSNESVKTPHPQLTSARSSFFVVQATSPNRERWRGWRTQCGAVFVVMKPWSWEEICIGGMKFEPSVSTDRLKKAFNLCGGSARQCFLFARCEREMVAWEEQAPTLLSCSHKLSVLANSLILCDNSTYSLLSSRIFCIVPRRNRYPAPSLVSPFAAYLVVNALEKDNPDDLNQLYNIFHDEPETLYAAKWLLEARVSRKVD